MIIINGSARSDGNTFKVCQQLQNLVNAKIVNLSDISINTFSYDGPADDDFYGVIETLVNEKVVIFSTPIYWYTMSGTMKNFLDRFTDLLKWNKELGRKLRGKKVYLISCSGHDDAPAHFAEPFELSAKYLGMEFKSYTHTWIEGEKIHATSQQRIIDFAKEASRESLAD